MIAVQDIAYVRYVVPDLADAESFMTDFGLRRAARTDSAIYMRGTGPTHHIYIAEAGAESGGRGFGLLAQSEDDLARLAAETGTRVEATGEPGGGRRVTLVDPAGNRVEVVHGVETAEAIPVREPISSNASGRRARLNRPVRLASEPAHVARLGHIALYVPDVAKSLAFYCDLLGMRVADTYYLGAEDNLVTAFLRCGLGSHFTDHHTIALAQLPKSGFDHASFEVLDWDDLMMGHHHLGGTGRYKHSWGVGRHFDGSNVFDYWRDPFGNKLERYTDGDLVNDDYQGCNTRFDPADLGKLLAMWGPPLSSDFLA
jgi:catechol 2,3-dioxygenase-like lactoylglutathione lyase family enzyme